MGEGPGSPHGDALGLPSPPPPQGAYELNAVAFMQALEAGLTGKAAGYAIGLNAGGVTIQQATGGWAQVPFDGTGPSGEPWTLDTRMFVASLNKILTAIAMTKLLADAGMSPDTPIIGYLPAYWVKGVNVDEITFANLLAHTSGLGNGNSRMDYPWMKAQIELGAPTLGGYNYQNVNYGLCRVLLAAVRGNVPPGFLVWPSQQNDLIWDCATINAYASYMAAEVFAPSGVHGPDFTFDPNYALGYDFPVTSDWNSGPQREQAAYYMSVNEVLRVMGTFRRGGSIVSPAQAQLMLDRKFGINAPPSPVCTSAGSYDVKFGGLNDGQGHEVQCLAFFLPLDMELVVFVNSPLANETITSGVPQGDVLYPLVESAYKDNLVAVKPVGPV